MPLFVDTSVKDSATVGTLRTRSSNGWRRFSVLILIAVISGLSPGSYCSAQTVKLSGQRKLVSRVNVIYPHIARQMGLRGIVKANAIVAPSGKVLKAELIGGSPIFVPYAMDAIMLMKWEPASKETREVVEIEFSAGPRR